MLPDTILYTTFTVKNQSISGHSWRITLKNKKALFNPVDVSSMADKIYAVLTNKDLRYELIQEGFNRVSDFSWQKTAEDTLKVYNGLFNE